ncbi:MAG: DUF488 family protein [Propionicimonas sp.]|nr:DUF488 family protein [Propionicimonas sp.]
MDGEAAELRVKRIYDPPDAADGYRVLVDRLWPRGMTSERAAADRWLAAVAPSHDLRRRWHHDPDRLEEFAAAYRAELDANPAVQELQGLRREHAVVTLLYAARDRLHNHALVLQDYLLDPSSAGPSGDGGTADA